MRLPALRAAVLAAVVVAVGARFIVLGAELRALRAHSRADRVVGQFADALEEGIRLLVARSRQPASTSPLWHRFFLYRGGRVAATRLCDPVTVRAIIDEVAPVSADTVHRFVRTRLYGPFRSGGKWVVAASTPLTTSSTRSGGTEDWSVAYTDVDDLYARAKLVRLAGLGYRFELYPSVKGGSALPYARSGHDPILNGAARRIAPPQDVLQVRPAGGWSLAIRPRFGWYPLRYLASQSVLVALVAWCAFSLTYDLSRRTTRWHEALEVVRRRLRSVHADLAAEAEAHRRLQKNLEFSQFHDAFTGLPNRRFFMDRLDRALRSARMRGNHGLAVMLIDVNRFALICDLLGQTAGDELMVQVAHRLARTPAVAERVIARWSGDQIAVLHADLHSIDTALSASALFQETLRSPFELRKLRVRIAASFGLTWVSSAMHGAERVLREAALAMSAAKAKGVGSTVVYEERLHGMAQNLIHLEADLHVAVERREFRLRFLPIVEIESGRVVGAEALLRWHHPVEGEIGPSRFLGVAEDAGITRALTRWVVDNACRTAEAWRRNLSPDIPFFMNVNVSASAIRDPSLAETVGLALERSGTPAGGLRFDIPEASLVQDLGPVREMLDRLRGMGVRLILDDFGTGFSSLSYLQAFPFDFLKIDQSLLRNVERRSANRKLLDAVVQLAHNLTLPVIAEGVETAATLAHLREIGCGYAQGHVFSPPVSAATALQMFQNGRSSPVATAPKMVRSIE